MNLTAYLESDIVTSGGTFAALDFSLCVLATILNVILLVTIKNSGNLNGNILYVIFASISGSNIIISSFVKLLSTVLVGHGVAKDIDKVPFQFCNIYIIFYRLTWFIFPYSIVLVSWVELIEIIKYRFFNSSSVIDFETSSTGRKSLVEEEGILTRRHNILKEREVIKIMKSLNSNKKSGSISTDSILSPKSKRRSSRKESGGALAIGKAWKSKANENKKKDSLTSKRKVLKQKSKSIDDTLETEEKESILVKRQSQSCLELNTDAPKILLHPIQEDEDGRTVAEDGGSGHNKPPGSGSFRRKIFAKSKSQQVTLSISPASSLKSFKSSNQSLSSLKKQVSFDDSLSEVVDNKHQSRTEWIGQYGGSGQCKTSLVSGDFDSDAVLLLHQQLTRPQSSASNVSTTASQSMAKHHVKYPLAIWSLAAIYAMIDEQLVKPKHIYCPITAGSTLGKLPQKVEITSDKFIFQISCHPSINFQSL